jgi:hypothetical protein
LWFTKPRIVGLSTRGNINSGYESGYEPELTVWLSAQRGGTAAYSRTSTDRNALKLFAAGTGEAIVKAAGMGRQKLYIVPSKRLVIVRMADRWGLWHWGFKDANFLGPILWRYGA